MTVFDEVHKLCYVVKVFERRASLEKDPALVFRIPYTLLESSLFASHDFYFTRDSVEQLIRGWGTEEQQKRVDAVQRVMKERNVGLTEAMALVDVGGGA